MHLQISYRPARWNFTAETVTCLQWVCLWINACPSHNCVCWPKTEFHPLSNLKSKKDTGSISGWGRFPGEGNGNPLQYSCLGNPTIEELGRLQSMGSQRVGYDRARACAHTHTHTHTHIHSVDWGWPISRGSFSPLISLLLLSPFSRFQLCATP